MADQTVEAPANAEAKDVINFAQTSAANARRVVELEKFLTELEKELFRVKTRLTLDLIIGGLVNEAVRILEPLERCLEKVADMATPPQT